MATIVLQKDIKSKAQPYTAKDGSQVQTLRLKNGKFATVRVSDGSLIGTYYKESQRYVIQNRLAKTPVTPPTKPTTPPTKPKTVIKTPLSSKQSDTPEVEIKQERAYNPNDPKNADRILDPKTGKYVPKQTLTTEGNKVKSTGRILSWNLTDGDYNPQTGEWIKKPTLTINGEKQEFGDVTNLFQNLTAIKNNSTNDVQKNLPQVRGEYSNALEVIKQDLQKRIIAGDTDPSIAQKLNTIDNDSNAYNEFISKNNITPGTPQPTSQIGSGDSLDEFNKGYDEYVNAAKDVYGLETAQQLEQFLRQGEDLETAFQKATRNVGEQKDDLKMAYDRAVQVSYEQGTDIRTGYERGLTSNTLQQQDLSTGYDRALVGNEQQQKDLNTQIARNREDYATYTSRNQQDFNREIASQNKSFSTKLSSATNAYGQRGILKSGFIKPEVKEATETFSSDQQYFKTLNQRQLADAAEASARGEEDYETGTSRLGTQKGYIEKDYGTERGKLETERGYIQEDYRTISGKLESQKQYASDVYGTTQQRLGTQLGDVTGAYDTATGRLSSDKKRYISGRKAGEEVLGIGLQSQGDAIYNQGQLANYQLLQQQREQESLDRKSGRKQAPIRIPQRKQGEY